jgi:hypothetical protein
VNCGPQVVSRHPRRHLRVRVVREVRAERRVEAQAPGLRELQRRDRGQHLVHRPDAEPRERRVRDALLPIGEAVGALEQRAPVAGDEHGAGELAGRRGGLEPSAERGHEGRVAGRLGGRRSGRGGAAGESLRAARRAARDADQQGQGSQDPHRLLRVQQAGFVTQSSFSPVA